MRVAILCSSPYSETGCAVAARLAQLGHIPVGALTLAAWDRKTLLRKVGQWGFRDSLHYAYSKLSPRKAESRTPVRNPYLEPALRRRNRDGSEGEQGNDVFRSLQEVGRKYHFPVQSCDDQNSPLAVAQLQRWSPDVAIFTGGNILREPVLKAPRLGVLNAHLALLPEIRGMSSPEWSLLNGVPLGITIHFMDSGIDTGPILLRREFTGFVGSDSFSDLRNRMIANGIELIAEVIAGLECGTISAAAQDDRDKDRNDDRQFFVMHERLKSIAAHRLTKLQPTSVAGKCDG
jgi:folate-dependent phosphoribosylglycinamide formyltransferase PurN